MSEAGRASPGKTTDNRRALRQPILYAHEMWRRQRLWVLFLLVVGVGASIATLAYPQLRSNRDSLNWIFFAYVPAGLLLGAGLLFYRWRSRAEVTDEGLKIGTLFSEVLLEYELVRTVRVQPLDRHFQDARVTRLYEGTDEILTLKIAAAVLGKDFQAFQ